MAAKIEGDERVMAAAQQIVKSLGTSENVTEDMILILSNFDKRLASISQLLSKGGGCEAQSNTEKRLEAAEKVVIRRDSNCSTPCRRRSSSWDDSTDEVVEYLSAVDEIIQLIQDLSITSDTEILYRAESLLQLAMSRLEDDFSQILREKAAPLDAERLHGSIRRVSLSLTSNDGDIDDTESSVDDEHETLSEGRGWSFGNDLCVDLVNSDAIADLKDIADRMIRSGYEKECCQVYSSARRDVLGDCLSTLGIEKLSIEEVLKIEWKSLNEKMKKWIEAVKIVIGVLLSGEKRLCEEVFGESGLISEVCFVQGSKGCAMQLLNFAEAIAIGRRSPEKLFRILDMYESLAGVLPELQVLFSDGSGDLVYREAQDILGRLGDAAKGTIAEFAKAVDGENSRQPVQGGEIHPLTRYVMNYIKFLVDYSDSLNQLLECGVNGEQGENAKNPLGHWLLSLISSLESNLEEKSKFYEDSALQYVFLMNNVHYLVQKVRDSELGKLLGDQWVRRRRGQVRQYSTSYLRASWTKVLSSLKDEGIGGGGGSSSNVSKVALRERFKAFNLGFEEIYKAQTAWKIRDPQLRQELRLSLSEKVIPAYRAFLGRYGSLLESGRHSGKYIKYTPEDLENYLSELFEGSPGLIHNPRRKSSS